MKHTEYRPKDYTIPIMLGIILFAIVVTYACQHLHPQFNPRF